MARTNDEVLRTCPTCGGETENLGLRNYEWLNDRLPGKAGLMDIDGVLERRGHILMIETKPLGKWGIPLGQRITFKTFVQMGVHVWIVWHEGDKVVFGEMDENGDVPDVEEITVNELADRIEEWYERASEGEL